MYQDSWEHDIIVEISEDSEDDEPPEKKQKLNYGDTKEIILNAAKFAVCQKEKERSKLCFWHSVASHDIIFHLLFEALSEWDICTILGFRNNYVTRSGEFPELVGQMRDIIVQTARDKNQIADIFNGSFLDQYFPIFQSLVFGYQPISAKFRQIIKDALPDHYNICVEKAVANYNAKKKYELYIFEAIYVLIRWGFDVPLFLYVEKYSLPTHSQNHLITPDVTSKEQKSFYQLPCKVLKLQGNAIQIKIMNNPVMYGINYGLDSLTPTTINPITTEAPLTLKFHLMKGSPVFQRNRSFFFFSCEKLRLIFLLHFLFCINSTLPKSLEQIFIGYLLENTC